MCLNEKHLHTKSNHDVNLQINFYGSCKFTENRSLLLNCQMSQSRRMGHLDFSFHHTPKILCICIYIYISTEQSLMKCDAILSLIT